MKARNRFTPGGGNGREHLLDDPFPRGDDALGPIRPHVPEPVAGFGVHHGFVRKTVYFTPREWWRIERRCLHDHVAYADFIRVVINRFLDQDAHG